VPPHIILIILLKCDITVLKPINMEKR